MHDARICRAVDYFSYVLFIRNETFICDSISSSLFNLEWSFALRGVELGENREELYPGPLEQRRRGLVCLRVDGAPHECRDPYGEVCAGLVLAHDDGVWHRQQPHHGPVLDHAQLDPEKGGKLLNLRRGL